MPFTETELANLGNAALDFYMKGPAMAQTLQERPLLDALMSNTKTFPGGKEFIRRNVKGEYTTTFQGYSHDSTVGYVNPANIKQTQWKWYELHGGISITETELKKAGLSIVDDDDAEPQAHTDKEMFEITALFEDKLDDMTEGLARDLNRICWLDGSQDPLVFPGVMQIVADVPTTGVLAGIDRAGTSWWRNRAKVGANLITASATLQTLTLTLQDELLQLRRYGGRPNMWLGGSTAFNRLGTELRAKGNPTFVNFVDPGAMDAGQAQIKVTGLGTFMYDPTLDDLGRPDYFYLVDKKHLKMWVMEGENMKKRSPRRPADKYVMYRAITHTACLAADQLNCHGVYQVA